MKQLRALVRHLFKESLLNEKEPQRIPFSFNLPSNVIVLSDIFNENGFELYVVGGAVRDMILGKEPKDYDLVSDATPDEVELMLSRKYKTIPTGKAFGIITVVMPDGEEYEIAKYRVDMNYNQEDLDSFINFLSKENPESHLKFVKIVNNKMK